MPLIVTPREHARMAEMYRQLAQLTTAGLPLETALKQIHRHPPARTFRRPLQTVLDGLRAGKTFSDALAGTGRWIPEFDLALLKAGEHSGRLDQCFKLLAEYHMERAQIARNAIIDLAYPVFLLHFAVFILGIPQLVRHWRVDLYLGQVFSVLAPLYALSFLVLYALQDRHGERLRAVVEAALRAIPVVGVARRDLALARLAMALEALLNAGYPIDKSWVLAASASGSPAIKRVVLSWKGRLDAGQTPGDALRASAIFPDTFVNLYCSGEVSGKLDESLRELARIYTEDGRRRMRMVATWIPRLIYIGIMLWVAYQIVTFWLNHYGALLQ